MSIITLNAGSSSIKFASFEIGDAPQKTKYGSIQNIKTTPLLRVMDENDQVINEKSFSEGKDYHYFFNLLFDHINTTGNKVTAIGHRVVHGGAIYKAPILLKPADIEMLKQFIPFAPLHQPYNLEAIEAIFKLFPNMVQVAAFDTAFHRTHPPVADQFAIPRALAAEGVCRYGFHGLSYEYIMTKLKNESPNNAKKRIIVAHLGNGASMCAIKDGISIDSTMGFTALDGLMMGTRCGTIDPGVVIYLMKFKNMNADEIQDMLYKQCGLQGVSNISSNMATLLQSDKKEAREAIDLFVYRAKRELGALTGILGGLDMLVFTGGIGENAPFIRQAICQDLAWLGNIEIKVIPTDEEWVIAKHTCDLIKKG